MSDWLEEMDRKSREREAKEIPYATVETGGSSMSWYIRISHGVMQWGPDGGSFWHWGTRDSAERKAARLLAKYLRIKGLESRARTRVDVPDPDGYRHRIEARHAAADALAELQAPPEQSWDREFASLDTKRRRRPSWLRRWVS